MIKLIAIDPNGSTRLRLSFSDGSWGVFDFARYLDAKTEMTSPLADPEFFARCFIEAGALAWPNGFDLSAASLQRRLEAAGELRRVADAA
jgi:Protein of unknown function (DUF2442)